MSRHVIKALRAEHICVVGYDRGMKTFFMQVKDAEIERLAEEAMVRVDAAFGDGREPEAEDLRAADSDSMVMWAGADRPCEVPTVEMLAILLTPFAELTEEMKGTLREEQAKAEATPRTGHQINMLDYIQRRARDGGVR